MQIDRVNKLLHERFSVVYIQLFVQERESIFQRAADGVTRFCRQIPKIELEGADGFLARFVNELFLLLLILPVSLPRQITQRGRAIQTLFLTRFISILPIIAVLCRRVFQ